MEWHTNTNEMSIQTKSKLKSTVTIQYGLKSIKIDKKRQKSTLSELNEIYMAACKRPNGVKNELGSFKF